MESYAVPTCRTEGASTGDLVVLAEHLKSGRILSTDERDFRTYRFKRHDPFVNLLLDRE